MRNGVIVEDEESSLELECRNTAECIPGQHRLRPMSQADQELIDKCRRDEQRLVRILDTVGLPILAGGTFFIPYALAGNGVLEAAQVGGIAGGAAYVVYKFCGIAYNLLDRDN